MQGYHRRPKFTTISIQYFQPEFLWLKNDVTESTHHLFFFDVWQMEQGLTELRKIFIKTVDKVIEEAKNTNEVEASLPSV